MSSITNAGNITFPGLPNAASSSTNESSETHELKNYHLVNGDGRELLHRTLHEKRLVNVEGRAADRLLTNHPHLPAIPLDRFEKLDEIPVRKLLCGLNKIYSGRMDHFTLVGGGVAWLLGSTYFQETLKLWDETTFLSDGLKQELDREPNDIDIFVHMNGSSTGLFQTMPPTILSKGYRIVKSSMIIFPGNSALYVQVAMKDLNARERLVDIMFYHELSSGGHLSSTAALQIPLNDYISGKDLSNIIPTSKDIAPQQAFLDCLLNKLSPHEILNDKGWVRMTHLLKMNAQITALSDWIRLAKHSISQNKSVSTHLLELIIECESSHPSPHRTGILFNALNAFSILKKHLPTDDALKIWEGLWSRLEGGEGGIDPRLAVIDKIIRSQNNSLQNLISACELFAVVLEVLTPSNNTSITARHVTSQEMLSFQLIFPSEGRIPNTLQLKAHPFKAYLHLETISRQFTEEPAWIDLLSSFLMEQILQKNLNSSLKANLSDSGFSPEQFAKSLISSKSPHPQFLQILDFYLLAAVYTLTSEPNQQVKRALFDRIPLLLKSLSPDRGISLLKTAGNVIGGDYGRGCKHLVGIPLLEIHFQALFADIRNAPPSAFQTCLPNFYDQCCLDLPTESHEKFLRLILKEIPPESTELRLLFLRRLRGSPIQPDIFYFTAFCQTVYRAKTNFISHPHAQEYGEFLIYFFESNFENLTPTPIRLETIPHIVESLINQNLLTLADRILMIGNSPAYRSLFGDQHGSLREMLVLGISGLTIETIPILEHAIHSSLLPPGLQLICRNKINTYRKFETGNLSDAIAEFQKLIAQYPSKEPDETLRQLVHLLLEKIDSRFSISSELGLTYATILFKEVRLIQLFPMESNIRAIHWIGKTIESRQSLGPEIIQSSLNLFLLMALRAVEDPHKMQFCEGVIGLLKHVCSSKVPLSSESKNTIKLAIPDLIKGVKDNHPVQIQLLRSLHGHGIEINPESALLFNHAIINTLQQEQQDRQTLMTLVNITKRFQNNGFVLSKEIVLHTCDRCFEIDQIENGKFWLDILFKQLDNLSPENRLYLRSQYPKWLFQLHERAQFGHLVELIPHLKKLEIPSQEWKGLFSDEFLSLKGDFCTSFLVEYPFSELSRIHPEYWHSAVKVILSKWITKGSLKESDKLMILWLLLEGKTNESYLWQKAYTQLLKTKSPKLIDKITKTLRNGTQEGLLDDNIPNKQLCWKILLQNELMSSNSSLKLLKSPEEVINAFLQSDGKVHEDLLIQFKTLYNHVLIPFQGKVPSEIIDITIRAHTQIAQYFIYSECDSQLLALEIQLVSLIRKSFTTWSYQALIGLMQLRLEAPIEILSQNASAINHISSLSRIIPTHTTQNLTLPIEAPTLDFIRYVTGRFSNEPWLVNYLSALHTHFHNHPQLDIKLVINTWIRQLHKKEITTSDDPQSMVFLKDQLYKCMLVFIKKTSDTQLERMIRLIELPQTIELLEGHTITLWKHLINKQTNDKTTLETSRDGISTACFLFERCNILGPERNNIYNHLFVSIVGHLDKFKTVPWVANQIIQLVKILLLTSQNDLETRRNVFFRSFTQIIKGINYFGGKSPNERPILSILSLILHKLIMEDEMNGHKNIDEILTMVDAFVFEPFNRDLKEFDVELHYETSMGILNALPFTSLETTECRHVHDMCHGYLEIMKCCLQNPLEASSSNAQPIGKIAPKIILMILERMSRSQSPVIIDHLFFICAQKPELFDSNLDSFSTIETILMKGFDFIKKNPFQICRDRYILQAYTLCLHSYIEHFLYSDHPEGIAKARMMFEFAFSQLEYPSTIKDLHGIIEYLKTLDGMITFVEHPESADATLPEKKLYFAELMTIQAVKFLNLGLFKNTPYKYLEYCERIYKSAKDVPGKNLNQIAQFFKCGLIVFNKETIESNLILTLSFVAKHDNLAISWIMDPLRHNHLTPHRAKEFSRILSDQCAGIVPNDDENLQGILCALRRNKERGSSNIAYASSSTP